jgi:hypothetical protein
LGWDTKDNGSTVTGSFAKEFSLLFTWKNPVTGSKPDFDGFNAVFKASIGADL